MRDDPIFILGQPRSGTTRLLRVLNATPGVRIYGEHGGGIGHVGQIYRALCKDHCTPYHSDISSDEADRLLTDKFSFCNDIGAVQTDKIRALCRSLLEAVGNPFGRQNIRWGFKEVQFASPEIVTALVELFPKCKIVMTIRNPRDTMLSQKRLGWGVDYCVMMREWCARARCYLDSAASHPANTRLHHYETLDLESVKEILNWLSIDVLPAHVEAALEIVGAAPKTDVILSPAELKVIDDLNTTGVYTSEPMP